MELEAENKTSTQIIPVLGDIKDIDSLENAFRLYSPTVVFHAAAYKHVDIVERNTQLAFNTNVKGTNNVLALCQKYNVKRFTLISTDKAVNPTNFMGATKRLAELLTSKSAKENPECTYIIVRFGNVMGSSGSALLKFVDQIKNSKSVTLTHPDMERYFMSIQEASSLVINASFVVSKDYDTNLQFFVLDMGTPIKLIHVIKRIAEYVGKKISETPTSDSEIKLEITGLRPGEKLYEELTHGESAVSTQMDKIKLIEHRNVETWSLEEEFKSVLLTEKDKLDQFLLETEELAH